MQKCLKLGEQKDQIQAGLLGHRQHLKKKNVYNNDDNVLIHYCTLL